MKLHRNLLLGAMLLMATQTAAAQEVEYQTASRIFLPGGLGKIVNFAAKLGGGSSEFTQTVRIKGDKMRTDDPGFSTVFDLNAKKYVTMDHKAKTYTELSTDEMAAQVRQLAAQGQATTKASAKTSTPDYKVSVDETNQTETIAGSNTKRSFITVVSAMRDSTGKKVGDFVIVTDSWIAKDSPITKANEKFNKAMIKAMGGERSVNAALGAYPGAGEALQKAAEEAKNIEGYPMRMTFHVIIVPDGIKFDRDKAIAEAEGARKEDAKSGEGEKKKKGGFGGALRSIGAAAKAAAANQQQSEQPEKEEELKQMTLLRLFTEVKSVKTGGVSSDAFEVPANYKKQTAEN